VGGEGGGGGGGGRGGGDTGSSSFTAIVQEVLGKTKRIDILVLNAGATQVCRARIICV